METAKKEIETYLQTLLGILEEEASFLSPRNGLSSIHYNR